MLNKLNNVLNSIKKLCFIFIFAYSLIMLSDIAIVNASSELIEQYSSNDITSIEELKYKYDIYNDYIKVYESYEKDISLNDGLITINSDSELSSNVELNEYLTYVNNQLRLGKIKVDENLNIFDVDDDINFELQWNRNKNKVIWNWWGIRVYASNGVANIMVRDFNNLAAGAVAVSAVAGYFKLSKVSLISGLASAYWWSLANSIDYHNGLYLNRGVRIDLSWILIYNVRCQ